VTYIVFSIQKHFINFFFFLNLRIIKHIKHIETPKSKELMNKMGVKKRYSFYSITKRSITKIT